MVQLIKGTSSYKIFNENRSLRQKFWGNHFWARGYFAVSSGNITDEMIIKYIKDQDGESFDSDTLKIGRH